jgi:hypothetical protein
MGQVVKWYLYQVMTVDLSSGLGAIQLRLALSGKGSLSALWLLVSGRQQKVPVST